MNRLKTFCYFIGVFLLSAIIVRIIVFISNKIFDNISDYLYVPFLGVVLGCLPLIIATDKALKVTNNEKRTLLTIIITFSILCFVFLILAAFNIWGRISLDIPLFNFIDEANNLNHWLYYLPYSISTILTLRYLIKNNPLL